MTKRTLICFFISFLWILSSCGSSPTPTVSSPLSTQISTIQPSTTPVPVSILVTQYTLTPTSTRTPTFIPTDISTITPTPSVTPTPTETLTPTPAPKFSAEIHFSKDEPTLAEARRIFLEGTQQIFAMWTYEHMDKAERFQRDWYLSVRP